MIISEKIKLVINKKIVKLILYLMRLTASLQQNCMLLKIINIYFVFVKQIYIKICLHFKYKVSLSLNNNFIKMKLHIF